MARKKPTLKDDMKELKKLLADSKNITDATDLNTLIAKYEATLAAFKAKVAAESSTISARGYTSIVQAAITVNEQRIAELKAKRDGSVTASNVSYLISQYTSQLDGFSYLGSQLCTGQYYDELSTMLVEYKKVLASLIQLNTTSKTAIASTGYTAIVEGAITLHTTTVQTLSACIPATLNVPSTGKIPGVRVDATVDGDTLTVVIPSAYLPTGAESKVNIRLAGCNAPEKPDTSTQAGNCVLEYTVDGTSSLTYVEKKFYSEATMKLGTLVGAKVVTLSVNPAHPFDSYNRLVAIVTTSDGIVANEEMLKAGLVAYFHRPEWSSSKDPVDHNKYILLESGAKAAKLGLWASAAGSTATGQCIITATRTTTTGSTSSISALVYVDNTYMGMTSTTDPFTLPAGEHTVKVVSSQYGTGTKEVTITEGGITTLNVPVGSTSNETGETTEKGYVTFKSQRLTAAGEYVGTTSEVYENDKFKFSVESEKSNVSVDIGEHTYVFKKDGYNDKSVAVMVEKDENVLCKATLIATSSPGTTDPTAQGQVDFISTPTSCKIYVDDKYIGLTKLLEYGLAPGSYTIWIKKEGYIDYTETILVEAGEKLAVEAVMSKSDGSSTTTPTTTATGTVDFTSTPTGAYIYVDNIYIGMTKKTGYKMTAGVHLVTFRKSLYEEWEDTISVQADTRLAVEATLTKSTTSTTAEEEEEEEDTTTNAVQWYTNPYANPYSSAYETGQETTEPSTSTGFTNEPSGTENNQSMGGEDEGMPVQIIVLQNDPDKETLGDIFKEVKKFFKKYCDTKLKFLATTQDPIESDRDEDGNGVFDNIDSIEDQLDVEKIIEDKGIVVLLWEPSTKSVKEDQLTLSRDEQLNNAIVCSVPVANSPTDFNGKIAGETKDHLGLTVEGSLSMVIAISNALLEWYLDETEAEEEDEDLPELDKDFCEINTDKITRPTAKCVKKWLKIYNKKIED